MNYSENFVAGNFLGKAYAILMIIFFKKINHFVHDDRNHLTHVRCTSITLFTENFDTIKFSEYTKIQFYSLQLHIANPFDDRIRRYYEWQFGALELTWMFFPSFFFFFWKTNRMENKERKKLKLIWIGICISCIQSENNHRILMCWVINFILKLIKLFHIFHRPFIFERGKEDLR